MPFGIVAFAFMLFSWTTFLETAVYNQMVTSEIMEIISLALLEFGQLSK